MYVCEDGSLSALPDQDGPRRRLFSLVRAPRGMPKPRTGRRYTWRQPLHYGMTFLPDGTPLTGHYQVAGGRLPVTTPHEILRGLHTLGDDETLGLFGIRVSFRHPFGSHSVLAQGARAAGKVAPLVALVPGVGIPTAMALSAAGKTAGKLASGRRIGKFRFREIVGAGATGAAEGAAVGVGKKLVVKGAQDLFSKLKHRAFSFDPSVPPEVGQDVTERMQRLFGPAIVATAPPVTDIIPAADVIPTAPASGAPITTDPALAQRIQAQVDQAVQAQQVAQERAAKTGETAPGAPGGADFFTKLQAMIASAVGAGTGGAGATAAGAAGAAPSYAPAPSLPPPESVAAEQASVVEDAAADTEGMLGGISPTMIGIGLVAAVVLASQGRGASRRRRGRR